jgi:hypothetical protein
MQIRMKLQVTSVFPSYEMLNFSKAIGSPQHAFGITMTPILTPLGGVTSF